jgi:hypothetical protein
MESEDPLYRRRDDDGAFEDERRRLFGHDPTHHVPASVQVTAGRLDKS